MEKVLISVANITASVYVFLRCIQKMVTNEQVHNLATSDSTPHTSYLKYRGVKGVIVKRIEIFYFQEVEGVATWVSGEEKSLCRKTSLRLEKGFGIN